MAATADGGNDFWTNLSEDAQILVRVDLTYADGTPRYWLELVEADDPNLLLEQNFDLFVWGGDYTLASGGKGTVRKRVPRAVRPTRLPNPIFGARRTVPPTAM